MLEKIKKYRPAFWWAFFILIICNISIEEFGKPPRFFAGFDKLTHCGLFFVLVVFTCINHIKHYRTITIKKIALITLLAAIYGGVIELLQEFIFTWRTGDWWDLFADSVGACMAAFSVFLTFNSMRHGKN